MIFRPEEIHPRSSQRGRSAGEGQRSMPDNRRGVSGQDLSVPHFDGDGLVAVKAWALDTNRFTWKKPADCQRVEASLSEPLLLVFHRNAVLGRDVRKGRDCVNQVSIRVKA